MVINHFQVLGSPSKEGDFDGAVETFFPEFLQWLKMGEFGVMNSQLVLGGGFDHFLCSPLPWGTDRILTVP